MLARPKWPSPAPTYVYGGPVPVAALAITLLGLEVNQRRGDELRAQLSQRTRTVLDHLNKLGVATSNVSDFPIVELALAEAEDLFPVGRYLFKRGVYLTWPRSRWCRARRSGSASS